MTHLDGRQQRILAKIIDRTDYPKKEEDSAVEKVGNADYNMVTMNPSEPLLRTMLDEMIADREARDALIPEYEKAYDADRRAASRLNSVTNEIQQLNARIKDTRAAMEALKARRRRP